jgi:hypothetical protein
MSTTTNPADDADAESDGHENAEQAQTHSVTRRQVLGAAAAAGAGATAMRLGVSPVAADHGSDDPIDIPTDDPDAVNGEYEDVDPARIAMTSAAGGALVAGGIGAVAGGALGYTAGTVENETEIVGNFVYGSYENRLDTQLQTDVYSHARTVHNENVWNLKQLDNRLDAVETTWIAQAQFECIQKINELGVGDSTDTETNTDTSTTTTDSTATEEQQVIDAGVDGVLDAAANAQRNALAIETATIIRHASFDAREDAADIPDGEKVTYLPNDGPVLGVKPLHITLVNGETVEAWGLHTEDEDDSGNTVERVVHSHNGDIPIVSTDDPDIPLDSGATQMFELVEEFEYNSDAGRVEYIDPESGDALRTGTDKLNVHHPDYVGAGNKSVNLIPDTAEYSDSTGTGLPGWWNTYVYPFTGVLCSEIETYASEVYDAIQAGDIDLGDLTTPSVFAENMARDWSESGDTGMSRELLSSLGIDTDLETSMRITVADQPYPDTVVAPSDRGVSETWSHSLVEATDSVSVAVKFSDGAKSGSDVIVPPGSPTARVTVDALTDDTDSPSYAVKEITVTAGDGTTTTVSIGSDGSGDSSPVGVGGLWHEDLAGSDTGAYSISQIDVTYISDGSEYTETVSSPSLTVNLDPSNTGWTYADAALATDWRPHGGVPENWSETYKKVDSFRGVSMSEVSGSVDVQSRFKHDGTGGGNSTTSTSTDTSSYPLYTVPESESLSVGVVSGDTSDVTGIIIGLADQSDHTVDLSSSDNGSVAHTDLLPDDGSGTYTVTTLTIEYNDGSGGTATTTAGNVDVEISPEQVDIPEFDFMLNKWYDTGTASEDDTIVIADSDGEWVDVQKGDAFKIQSATDVDGNKKDGVTLSDTNRRSLDPSRVEEEVTRAIELEKATEGGGGGAGGGGGGGGGGSGMLAVAVAALGGGAAYLYSKGVKTGAGGGS